MTFDVVFGTDEPAPEHVAWCRQQIDMIRLGGVWAIPRSGLIFTKTGDDEFTLTARMPWMQEMEGTITAEQLAEQQQDEYETNRRYFAAAGVTLKDATDPNCPPCPACGSTEPDCEEDCPERIWQREQDTRERGV